MYMPLAWRHYDGQTPPPRYILALQWGAIVIGMIMEAKTRSEGSTREHASRPLDEAGQSYGWDSGRSQMARQTYRETRFNSFHRPLPGKRAED